MSEQPPVVALANVTRDGVVESTHYGRIAVCEPDGRLLASAGDPDAVQYWRSSSKPIQALSVVTSGAADSFALTVRELAVCCASHSGSAMHTTTVLGILDKLGLSESDLQCGVHWPGDSEERDRLIREREQPGPRHNNCSGKHAGMLATCLALGADPAHYMDLNHPVQRLVTEHLCLLGGIAEQDIVFGRDGCGLPTAGVPLRSCAQAFANLADPSALPVEVASAVERITAAMAAAPEMVSAPGSFNTELLAAGAGDVVAKGGAEGLFCMGVRSRAVGVAFKTADGSSRAHAPIALELLRRLNVELPDDLVAKFARVPVMNCHQEHVGDIEPVEFELVQMA